MSYRILSIDASGVAHRCWFGASDRDKAPEYFIKRLQSLQLDYCPELTYVVWDKPGGSDARKALLPAYKSKRPDKSEGYLDAVEAIRERLGNQDCHQVWGDGEADDVLAAICHWQGPHLIASADKDLIQLIRPGGPQGKRRVDMLKLGTNKYTGDKLLTYKNLAETSIKFNTIEVTGLEPADWTDLLSLAGDTSDGIPGIKGIGARGAFDLIRACPGVVERLLIRDDDGVSRIVAAEDARLMTLVRKCIKRRDELRVSRELVRLNDMVEIEVIR
jgi:DNA polymerase-1